MTVLLLKETRHRYILLSEIFSTSPGTGGQGTVSLAASPLCLASTPSGAELAPMDFAGLTAGIFDQICLQWVV